jgi:hypothetical protein
MKANETAVSYVFHCLSVACEKNEGMKAVFDFQIERSPSEQGFCVHDSLKISHFIGRNHFV